MLDLDAHPMSLLLVHNALAILVAFVLTQLLRGNRRIAVLSFVIAASVSYQLRSLNPVCEFGWQMFIDAPIASGWRWVVFNLEPPRVSMVGWLGLIYAFLSPLVFAVFTAHQWSCDACKKRGRKQIALRSLLLIATIGCFVLGISSWFRSKGIALEPLIVTAACILIRPARLWTWFRHEGQQDKRMAELRRNLI